MMIVNVERIREQDNIRKNFYSKPSVKTASVFVKLHKEKEEHP
jgi:hypothetical protein